MPSIEEIKALNAHALTKGGAHQDGKAHPCSPGTTRLVQLQRTCWWSGSRRSHPKCWCTRSMSSWAVDVRSGSRTARLPCNQRGSIGLSQGLFTGNRHTRIRTPPVRFTVRLCVPIHACTARLTCQAALSHTRTHTRLSSAASRSAPQARKSVVTRLTGRPSTKRSSTRSWSVRNSPCDAADRAAFDKAQQHSILVGSQQPV